jgi:uncharacterized coiled-coil protein SlyX
MSFIPEDDYLLKKDSPYFMLSKLDPGKHKVRILDRPINGWIDWLHEKNPDGSEKWTPIRTKPKDKRAPLDPKKSPVAFWCMPVWVYDKKCVCIWDLQQNSVIKELKTLAQDPDFGDCRNYDIVIRKTVENKITRYTVVPLSKAALSKEIVEFYRKVPINLHAMYDNKDPFNDFYTSEDEEVSVQEDSEVPNFVSETPPAEYDLLDELEPEATLENLTVMVAEKGVDTKNLQNYVKNLADEKQKTQEQILEYVTMQEAFPMFLENYKKFVA